MRNLSFFYRQAGRQLSQDNTGLLHQFPAIGIKATRANNNEWLNLLTPAGADEYWDYVYARHADRESDTGSKK